MATLEQTPEAQWDGTITKVQAVLDRYGEYEVFIEFPEGDTISMNLNMADIANFGIHRMPKAGLKIEWTGNAAHPENVRIVDNICDDCAGNNTHNPKLGALENRCNLQRALTNGDVLAASALSERTTRGCLPTARATGLASAVKRERDLAVRSSQRRTIADDLDS